MTTIQTVVLIAHTIIALLIIVLVLLQRGKGADAGAAFGSGASGTVFGARGSSNFFSRATAIMATVFFASSLGLAYLSSQQAGTTDSLLENAPPVEVIEAPTEAPTEAPAADALPELGEVLEEPASDVSSELPDLATEPADEPVSDPQ
ncbi:MAG: preprotein translocase subunit SecG [Pseudomonadota bacterium]